MLPLPLILALILAALVIVIVFLLFRSLGKDEDKLTSGHSLRTETLENDLVEKDDRLKELELQCIELKKQAEAGLKEKEQVNVEITSRDKLVQELKGELEPLKQQVAEQENADKQLEQQKKQFHDQVIKCKKLEKDLHLQQDQVEKLQKEKEALKKELEQLKKTPESAPEPAKPEPTPKPAPPNPEQELKQPEPIEGKPSKSAFSRFLRPKDIVKEEEEQKPS